MTEEIIYKVTKSDLESFLTGEVEQKIYNRFDAVIVDFDATCQILCISKNTLLKYINEGVLTPEPRFKNEKILFKLSHLMRADIKQIKKTLKK